MVPSYIVAVALTSALVFCRIGGFLVLSPFPGAWVPMRMRVALLISLSLSVGVLMAPPVAPVAMDLDLLLVAASDFLVGLFIGAAFRLVISAAEFMAGMVSQASWLSAPVSMNPDMGGQSQVLGTVSTLLALLVAIGAGMHRIVLAYLLESFNALPVGTMAHIPAAVPTMVELAGRSFDVGMRLALPVLAVSLAVQTALAILARVAPSLQIFSIGFAVLVGSGLVTFMASLPSIAAGILRYLGTLDAVVAELFQLLAGG